jgi:hypothetical protein
MPAQRKWSSIVTWRWSWITGNSEIIPLCPQSHISGNVDSQLMRSQGALSFTDTQCSVMRPPSAKYAAATFCDHQRVCTISSTPKACGGAAAVRSGRGPSQAPESKVRFAANSEVTLELTATMNWRASASRLAPTHVLTMKILEAYIGLIPITRIPLADCHVRDNNTMTRNAESRSRIGSFFLGMQPHKPDRQISSGSSIATQRCHWIDAGGAPRRDCAGDSCYQAEQQCASQQHDGVMGVAVGPLRDNLVQAQGKCEAA